MESDLFLVLVDFVDFQISEAPGPDPGIRDYIFVCHFQFFSSFLFYAY